MNGAASERLLSDRHSQYAMSAVMTGTGARIAIWGQENHRSQISALRNGVHRLTAAIPIRTPTNDEPSQRPRPILERSLGFQDQPARAEQAVAEDERDAGQERERGEAVERTAGEVAAFGLEALDERAEHDALGESAEDGAVVEGVIPEGPMLGVAVAELERDAAKDERQQHDEDRKIDRRYDDGEGERERPPCSAIPPRTSQVSLPSQIGAIEFMTRLRESRSGANP